jgi:hypothetical protein
MRMMRMRILTTDEKVSSEGGERAPEVAVATIPSPTAAAAVVVAALVP